MLDIPQFLRYRADLHEISGHIYCKIKDMSSMEGGVTHAGGCQYYNKIKPLTLVITGKLGGPWNTTLFQSLLGRKCSMPSWMMAVGVNSSEVELTHDCKTLHRAVDYYAFIVLISLKGDGYTFRKGKFCPNFSKIIAGLGGSVGCASDR